MTDPIEIPLSSDTPLYTIRVTLDGQEYIFKFDWNERENRWYFSLFTIDEKPLATGIKLVANWPLLRRFTSGDMPPGILIAGDFSPLQGEAPTYAELGVRVRFLYFPANA